jgi:hypothetical protein
MASSSKRQRSNQQTAGSSSFTAEPGSGLSTTDAEADLTATSQTTGNQQAASSGSSSLASTTSSAVESRSPDHHTGNINIKTPTNSSTAPGAQGSRILFEGWKQ